MNRRWIASALTAMLLLSQTASAAHLHYFGKERQYFGRFDISDFVEQFKENQDKVFARYQSGWAVSSVKGKTNTFVLEPKKEDAPSFVLVEFREAPNGAAMATLTTVDKLSKDILTDATLLFEDGHDLTPHAFTDEGKNTSFYLKFMQGFLVYVLSQQLDNEPANEAT